MRLIKTNLLVIFVIAIVLSNKLSASNFENLASSAKKKEEVTLLKKVKIEKEAYTYKWRSVLPIAPPTTVAGSSCGPGIINLSATGASGDVIEWFSDQSTLTVLATGNTYSPNLSVTTTFYVSARSALGTSTRVPVVASVYNVPPPVKLSSVPVNNAANPLCLGTSVTFTANGGADLFEFSVDGVVKQAMSSNRIYTTNTLTNGQVVSVKSRYAVTMDGSLSESAWGTGPLEDNALSATLSGNASIGYINALKISPTEDKLVFGIAGKALNYRRIMVFLDTKPGGFNVSNYGDENGSLPDVRAFNYFNNNPSTFDSYFSADYCLAIATDAGQTNYYADVIELKTGNSIKTYLGTAATGVPTAVMGVNKNNTGISDYNLGFEVEVSKALVGYTGGDVKFFAFTMQDNFSNNYNVTNSFLSPATRTTDYGSGAIDYNNEAPNPVVVAGAALTPCYSSDSMTMSFAANPTIATVGQNQPSCSLISGVLGGNTPSVGKGVWSKKSGPGSVSFSDSSLGNATATVSAPGTYVFTWTISSGQCTTSSADVTVVYNVTDAPTGLPNQNFCKINNPKVSDLLATGNNIEWFATASGGTPIPTSANLATGSYFAEQTNATTFCKSISRLKVDVIIDNPVGPTVSNPPFCNTAKVSDLDATGTTVKWYAAPAGGLPLDPNTNLVSGETYYATQTVTGTLSCESAPRNSATIIINTTAVPTGPGSQTICNSGTIADLTAYGSGVIKWYAAPTGGSPLLSSQILVSGTTYYASQTISNCESATRYPNTITINNPQIPVSGGDQSVCATSPLQTLTATASVSSGTIVWYDAMTNGSLVTSPILNSVGSITYFAQNNIASCSSISRTAVTLEIKDSPFLNVTGKTCSADLLTYTVNFTVASGSTISWSPSVGALSGNSIINIPAGTDITITASKGIGCSEVFNVTAPVCSCAIINNPVSGGNKSICEGQVNPILSATVNAGETIDWYGSSNGGVPLISNSSSYTTTVTAPGVYTYYSQARKIIDGCLSSSRTPVSLSINSQSKPSGAAIQEFCESQNATVGNLVAIGTGIKWYAVAVGGSPLLSTATLVDGKDYYASQTGSLCESVGRLKVTVTVNAPAAPTTTVPNPVFCNYATVAELKVSGTNVKWYDSLGNLLKPSSLLTDGEAYSATQTVNGCESVNKLNVRVTIEKPSAIIMKGSGPQTFCESENATVASLTARVASGVNIKWYSSATGDTPLPNATPLISGSYYGSQSTALGCESTPRLAVTVKINAPVSPTGSGIQLFCSSQSAKISDLQVTGIGSITWYDAAVSGIPLLGTGNLVDGKKYYATQTVSGCESVNNLEVLVGIVDPLTPTIATQTPLFCESQNSTLNSIVLNGIINNSNVVWYDAPFGGVVLSSNTPITLGGVYYAVQQSTTPKFGCESISRLKISPVIDKQQPPVIDNIIQPTCAVNSGSISFSGLPTSGNWTIIPSMGAPVNGSGSTYVFKNLIAFTDYTFKVTNGNSCTSVNSSVVATINAVPTAPTAPIAFSIVQPTCGEPTGAISIASQTGMEYSLDGTTYQSSNMFSGLAPKGYTLYGRNVLDATCSATSAGLSTINAVPTAPIVPTVLNIIQPTCGVPSGTITIASQAGMEYSLNGTAFQSSNVFSGLAPKGYTLYVRNVLDATCSAVSVGASIINAVPTSPVVPTTARVVQPTCAVPSGTITIASQTGMEYSLDGTAYQASNVFSGLAPKGYTIYVRNVLDTTCSAVSAGVSTINAVPIAPTVPVVVSIVQPTCAVPSGSIAIASQTGMEYSLDGTGYQLSNVFSGLASKGYTLYVRNVLDTTCSAVSASASTINSVATLPTAPVTASVVQPTCGVPSGAVTVVSQTGMEYSLDGTTYQTSNAFSGLAPKGYTLYVRNVLDATCSAVSAGVSTINAVPSAPTVPTALSIVQPTCSMPSGSIAIASQTGMEYSLDGTTFQLSNVFSGLAPKGYMLYLRNILDASCSAVSAGASTINSVPTAPTVPTALSIVQPTCAVPSGSIVIASQTGMEYSLDGTTYQLSNLFSGLAPNNYALYVRNIRDATCMALSLVNSAIDAKPLAPASPTLLNAIQPSCSAPFGAIEIASIPGVEYSIGNGYQDDPKFFNLPPKNYKISVRFKNNTTCETFGLDRLVNEAPPEIQFESTWTCQSNKYELSASPLSNSYDPNAVEYIWKDQNGNNVGTNSNVLNVTDVIDATAETETFPLVYTLTVKSNSTDCETTSNIVVESIYCDIQKGISPDGNGSNDYFDLRLMDVKKLEIFNRYGIQVYSQSNYTNQWSGQTSSGEALPSATYYYVINFNNGKSKTGWIYLIREN